MSVYDDLIIDLSRQGLTPEFCSCSKCTDVHNALATNGAQ